MNKDRPEYMVQCFNCLGEFDAMEALWCSHDPHNPTKICPYCLNCFCNVPPEYVKSFWENAPESLKKEHTSFRENRHPLGNLLVQAGVITMEQMLHAVGEQTKTGERLGEILVRNGLLTEEEINFFLSLQDYQVPTPLKPEHADKTLLMRLTPLYCYSRRIFPLKRVAVGDRSFVLIACPNRTRSDLMEELREQLSAHPIPFLVDETEIVRALKPLLEKDVREKTTAFDPGRWLSQLIAGAIARNGSDIHLDPAGNAVQVRIRIDGVLYKWQTLSNERFRAVIPRLRDFFKIVETGVGGVHRGQAELRVRDHHYRIQCMLLPTHADVSVTLKIINLTEFLKDIDQLGMLPDQLARVKTLITHPHGLVAVTGPPMHGTVTTEYAILRYLQRVERKIITIESPVHHPLKGVHQIELEPARGKDLRSVLEQVVESHPDVIYVAALPGPDMFHRLVDLASASLIIVDLNAMNVWEALRWMLDARVSPTILGNRLRLVTNHRLVRRLC